MRILNPYPSPLQKPKGFLIGQGVSASNDLDGLANYPFTDDLLDGAAGNKYSLISDANPTPSSTGIPIVAATNSKLSTFTEKGVLLTPSVQLGDYNSSGYVLGVQTSNDRMTFLAAVEGGTFETLLVAAFVGVTITGSNGYQVRLDSLVDTTTFHYVILNGATDQQIEDNFKRGNALTFDMTTSLYATDVSGWITKREAGTGESGLTDAMRM